MMAPKAGVPYLVLPSSGNSTPTFEKVDIKNVDRSAVRPESNGISFCGNYGYIDNLNVNLPDENHFIFGSSKADGTPALGRPSYLKKEGKLLGTRAYIEVAPSLQSKVRSLSVRFDDGEATAIENVLGDVEVFTAGKVYNLQGQYVGDSLDSLPKGIYIINGKKVRK